MDKITANHEDTIILKIKDHLIADINSSVIEVIISSLLKNTVCQVRLVIESKKWLFSVSLQALYIQNLSKAIGDDQLTELIRLFKRKKIWCLNIGETYEVSNDGWQYFCQMLPETSITHLYVSEHVISIELKNLMRFHIRENRKKHNKHCSLKNLKVIEKCTNMWW